MQLSKLEIAFSSPAFWSIIGLAAYNLLGLFVPQMTGVPQEIANVVLLALAAYLHPAEVQTAGSTH